MDEFSRDEQSLISKLQLLKKGDFDVHVKGDLKIRVMREIALREAKLMNDRSPAIFRLPRFASFFAGMAALALVITPVTLWAAQGSVPGDILYPVKIARENAALWLTRDPARQMDLKASLVTERVREARIVANVPQNQENITAALKRYEVNVQKVRAAATVAEREELNVMIAKLADATAALLEEAQKQLDQESRQDSALEISQKFVDAAGVSIVVLSEFTKESSDLHRVDPVQIIE